MHSLFSREIWDKRLLSLFMQSTVDLFTFFMLSSIMRATLLASGWEHTDP